MSDTIIPGTTHCHCDPPRYVRRENGTWGSRIFTEGQWRLIDDGAKKCRGCGMDLRAKTDAEANT